MKRLLVVAALAFLRAICAESALAQVPYTGEIRLFGFNFCPKGWAPADGQIQSLQQNVALFSLYGTMFGGDGLKTFALPNLVGSAPVGWGWPTDLYLGQTLSPVSTGANRQFGGVGLIWCVAIIGVYPDHE